MNGEQTTARTIVEVVLLSLIVLTILLEFIAESFDL